MKHAIANTENATSRYSLSTKVLAVFLSIAMVVTFSHFNAFAEFIQGGAKDNSFVQVKTSLENVVITDTSTQVSYKQADVDALGYLPAAADKVVTFTVTPYDNAATPGPDYTLSEVSYAGGALSPNASGQYSFTPVEGAQLVVKAVAVAAETPAAAENEKPAATDGAEGAATAEGNKGAEASDASQGAASTNNSNDAANAAAGTDANKGAAEATGADNKTPAADNAAAGEAAPTETPKADATATEKPATPAQPAGEASSSSDTPAASEPAPEPAVNTFSVNHIGGFFNLFGGINVVVKGSEGMLPADAVMSVSLVKDKAVEKMLETAAAAENKEMVDSVVVDITFTDAQGNAIEPKGPVSVNFEGVNLKGDSVGVYHVTDALDKVTPVATLDSATDAFAAEHFSTYALIGKIDAQPVVPEGQKIVTVNYVGADGSLVGKGHTEQIGIDEKAINFTVLNSEMYGTDVTVGPEGGYELSVSATDQAQYGITITDNQQIAIANLPSTEQISINLIVQGKETTYRVVEKTEKLNATGTDKYDIKETVVSGRVGDIASFNPEQKEGFTATGFLDQVIKADASTVIEGAYDRNTYTLKYNTNGGSYIEPKSGVYEQEITVFSGSSSTALTCTKEVHQHTAVPTQAADKNKNKTIGCYTSNNHGWYWSDWQWDLTCGKAEHAHSDACYTATSTFNPEPTKTGYVFGGWYLDEACTTPASEKLTLTADAVVYAKWTPMNVGYKVVYLIENADDSGFSYLTSTDASAQVGSTVTASASTAPAGLDTKNFTFSSATTETVKADGSTVVTVKYTRNVYTVTWKGVYYDSSGRPKMSSDYPGTPVTLTAKYGQNITTLWQETFNRPYGKAWNFTTENNDKFVTIDTMPSGNKDVYQFYFATDKKQTLHYWLEGYTANGAEQKTYKGVTYGLYKAMEVQFNYLYDGADFYEISGYTKGDYEGCTFGRQTTNGQQVHFYYRGNEYNLDLYGYQGASLGSHKLKLNADISSYLSEPAAPFDEAIFDGWFVDPEHAQPYTGNYQMPTGLALYAGWHAPVKTVTVHLNYEGAGTADTIEVTKGEVLDAAQLPSEEELEEHNPGYDFTGWYTDENCTAKFDQNRPIEADTAIYAGWAKSTKVAYTVKHVAVHNGVETEISSVEARGTIGQDVKVVKLTDDALTAAGYEGYLSASGASQFLNLSAVAADNVVTFRYMTLDDLKYTVSYVYNGTTVFVENNGTPYDCKSDVAFSVYPNEEAQHWIAMNGYTLKSTFVKVEPGQNAVFELILAPYTITYDLQGGAFAEGVTAPETYTISQVSGTNTIAIPNPESTGRTFTGWTLTEGTYVHDSDTPSDTLERDPQKDLVLGEVNGYKTIGHLTLKANWQDNAYAFVRFVDANGAVVANDALAQRFGLTAAADANGWYTLGYEAISADKPAAEYAAGTVVKDAPDAAYLTGIKFDAAKLNKFPANAGFNGLDNIAWEQFTVDEGAFGYFDTPNVYHLNGSIQVNTVKYVDGVDDEVVFPDVVGYGIVGDDYPQFGADPVRPGYLFTGWLAPNGTVMTTAEVEALKYTGDATYVAQWSEKKYDVTYVSAGNGTVSNTEGDKGLFVLSTEGITGATAVADLGYKFEGWYQGATFVTNAEVLTPAMVEPQLNYAMDGGKKVYENTEFTAKFTKDDTQTHRLGYTVEYYKNGALAETSPVVYGGEAWIGDATSLAVKEGAGAGEVATSGKFPGYHFEKLTLNGTTDIDVPFDSYDLTLAANAASSEGNVFKVYYVEDANVTINYVANTGGTVSTASEQVAPATGAAKGSTATASTGYVFDYWSTDAAGQNKVGADNLFVPEKNAQGIYEAATYYANFKLSGDKHVVAYEVHYFKQNAAGAYEEVIADAVAKKTSDEQQILTPATINVTESLDKNKYEGYVYATSTEAMNGGAAVTIDAFPSSYTNSTQAAGEEAYVINCYYDLRTDLSYTVKYYWAGDTSTTIAADETVTGQTFGATVSLPAEKQKAIAGYTYKNNSGDITIAVSGNVINVYYYKNVELTANSDTKTYNGAVQNVAGFTGAPADAQFNIAVGAAGTAVGTYPAQFAAGTVGTVDATGNYVVSSVTDGALEITPLDVTVEITGKSATNEFDGNAHTVTGYTTTINSGLFTEDLISFTGTATATRTEVGTTYMGLAADQFASDDTHNFNVTFTVAADGFQTITPVAAEVIVDIYENARTVTYDGTEHAVAGYDAAKTTISNPLYTADMFTATETAAWIAKGTDAGTYPVGVSADDFTNNATETFPNVRFVIHDGALVIDPVTEEVTVTVVGNSATDEYDGTEHTVTGYQVTSITNAAYNESKFTFTGDATAARTDEGTTFMGLKAGQFANTDTTNFTNVTFVVTDGFQKITPVAAEVVVTITGAHATDTYDGSAHTVTGYTVGISNDLYTEGDFTFAGDATATRTEVGTTDMGLAAGQFANNNKNFSRVTFKVTDGFQTITPVTDQVTVTINGNQITKTYDGNAHTANGYSVNIDNPLYTDADFTFSGTAMATRFDVGTMDMGMTADQFTNTNPNFANVKFVVTDGWIKINPLAVEVTVEGANDATEYDGNAHTVEGYTATADSALYNVDENVTFTGQATATRTDAGTTNMGLAVEQFENTNANFDVTFIVIDGFQTIMPVAAEVTVTIVGNSATNDYDGAPHTVTGYTVTTSNPLYTEDDFTFSGDATATRTENGTTYMGMTVADFANKSANFANVTFVVTDGYQAIGAIDVVVTIAGNTATNTYDGTEHTVTGYQVTNISNTLYTEADFTFAGTATAARTDAGSTNMGLKAADFTNKNENFKNVTFVVTDGYQTIDPLAVTVSIVGNSDTTEYDGNAHTVEGFVATVDSALYDVNADILFTGTATAERTDAGKTDMGLAADQFANTNANFDVTFTVTDGFQAITPVAAEVTVTIDGNKVTTTYDGEVHRATGYTVGIDNPLYTDADFTFTGTAMAQRTNVGTTYMGLAEGQFSNVNPNFAKVKFVVTDGWMKIDPLAVTVNIAGNSNTTEYDGEAHTVEGYTATADSLLYDTAANIQFTGAATAARTDAGTTNMGLTAAQFTNENDNFTVTFVVTDGFQKIEKIDAVVTIIGNTVTADYDGTVHTATGYVAEANTDLYNVATDFTFAGAASAARTDAGTTNMGLAAGQFTNTNPNFENVTFVVTDGFVKVNPVETTVTIVGNTVTADYDGEVHTATGYVAKAASALYDVNADIQFTGTATAERTDAGTTNMGLAADQFVNQNANFSKVTFVVTDGFAKVNPISVTVTINGSKITKTYDGAAHIAAGYAVGIDNPLYTPDDIAFTGTSTAQRTNVGTTYMGLAEGQFSNANPNFANVKFVVTDGWMKIDPLAVEVTIAGNNDTTEYDGNAHTVEGYVATADSDLYDTAANIKFTGAATATRTDAGTTNMGLTPEQFVNANDNFTVTFTVIDGFQAITPVAAEVTVTIVGNSAKDDYDGEEHIVTGYQVTDISNPLYTEGDFAFSGDATAARTDNGTTYMGMTAADFANTSANFANVTFVVTDGYQAIGAIDVVVTIVGNHATDTYDGTEHTVAGYQVTNISSRLYTQDDFTFTGAAEAARTDAGTTNMGLAASQFTNNNANFKNVMFNVTDGYQTITPLAVEVAIAGNNDTTEYDGNAHTVEGYVATANSDLYDTAANIKFTGAATATRTDAGTTNMGLTPEQFVNANDNFTVTFTVTDGFQTITPVAAEVTVTINGSKITKTYDGAEHIAAGYAVGIDNPLYTPDDIAFTGTSTASRTEVGTTYMGLAEDQFSNKNPNFTNVKFVVTDGWMKIDPLAMTVTVTGNSVTADYDGTVHTATGYVATATSSLYDTAANVQFTGDATATRTDVGTTNMGLTAEQFANTNANFDVTFTVIDGFAKVNPIETTVTIVGNKNTTEYDGNTHTVEGYVATATSALYDVNANIEFTGTAVAERTEIGTTNMNLAAAQFSNNNPNFSTVTFVVTDGYQTITPVAAQVVVTIVGNTDTKTFDGAAHTATGYTVTTSSLLYTESDFTFAGAANATRTNAGTTNMGLAADQFSNANPNFADVKFVVTDGWMKIDPLAVEVAIVGNNDTTEYDGNAHTVEGYAATADSDLYDTAANIKFTGDATATRTDAGTTNMGLAAEQFANTNGNFTVTFTVTDGYQTITPVAAEVTVTIVGNTDTKTFDGEEHEVTGYQVTGISNPLYAADDFTFAGDAIAARTNVGTTDMGLAADQFSNANDNFANVVFNVTDGWMKIDPLAVEVAIVGNNDTAEYDGNAHTVEGYTATADSDLYDTAANIRFTGDATATRTNAGTTYMNLAANQFSNTNGNFNVTFKVTDGFQAIGKTTAVVTIVGNTVTTDYDGTEHAVDGYTVSIDTPLYTENDFTFTGTAAAARTDAGTTSMGLTSGMFVNNNDNFETVVFNVTDGYVKIDPIAATVTVVGNTATNDYDGNAHTVEGYVATASTPLYDVTANIQFTGAATATRTDAGTTNMGLAADQFSNTNPNFSTVEFVVTDGWQKIDPISATVTIVGNSVTTDYDGTAHTAEGYVATANTPLYKVDTIRFAGAAIATRTDAGTTNMGLAADQFYNTDANFTNVTFIVTDGFVTINPIEATVEIVGNNNTTEYDGNAHTVEGYVATASTPLYDVNANIQFTGAATATRTDAGTTNMGLAADQFSNTNPNFSAVTFVVTDGFQTITPVAGKVTVTVTEKSDTVEYDGNEHSITGYKSIMPDNPLYNVATSVAETPTATWTATGTNAGTYPVGIAAEDFANTNGNFAEVSFVVVDGALEITPVAAEVVVTVTEKSDTVHYDAAKHSITGYKSMVANNPLYDVTTSVAETPTAAWTAEGVLVGTYPVGIVASDFENTNGNFAKVTFAIVDGALVIDDQNVPDDEVVNKTHDGRIDGTAATDLGKTITFDITVKNIYNETKTITLEEKEGYELSETTFDLAPGQEKTVTATHVVTESDLLAGEIENVVTAKFGDMSWTATDKVTPTKPYANLVVNKTANVAAGTVVKMGDVITYTITAHNDGNISIHNVVVTDELLDKEWTIQTLAPQQTVTFTEDYTVTQADSNRGYVTNVAVAKGDTEDPKNPEPDGEDDIIVPVETQIPALVITKTADITSGAVAGDVITYTVTATNSGTSLLTNIVVNDPLTGDRWTIDQLTPGDFRSFTTTYTVTVADMAAGSVVNTVTGSADNPTNDPTTVTPGQETTTTVTPVSSMNVTKVITSKPENGKTYVLGEKIAYRVTVTNTGNVELTNIVLNDTLVPLEPIERLAPGASQDIDYTYTVTEKDVAAGTVVNTVTGTGTTPDDSNTPTATDTSEVSTKVNTEVIDDNPTPLATHDGHSCWVHWLMLLGILLTLIYGIATVVRRKKFADDVAALDKELTGAAPADKPEAKNDSEAEAEAKPEAEAETDTTATDAEQGKEE